MAIYFATSNKHKFEEATNILAPEIEIKHFYFKHNEIRSDSVEEIALDALKHSKLKKPVFVEDTGLFIAALNGFPGTFSAWVLAKIGSKGILKLMKGKNRSAAFRTCIAFTNGKITKIFMGECKGKIAYKQRGTAGFGYDSIFIPQGYRKTFAEATKIKKKVSQRYKALMKLKKWITKK